MRVLLFVLFVLGALAVGVFVPLETVPQFVMRYEDLLTSYGAFVALCFVLVYALAFGFTVPITTLLALGAGAVFGFVVGFVLVLLGTVLGALVVFLSARGWARPHCERLLGTRLLSLVEETRAHPFSFLLSTRFAPLVPFPIAHIVPALVPVSIRDFLMTTLLGTIPSTIAFVALGTSFMRIQMGENHIVEFVSLALATLSLTVLLPVWWRWYRKRKGL